MLILFLKLTEFLTLSFSVALKSFAWLSLVLFNWETSVVFHSIELFVTVLSLHASFPMIFEFVELLYSLSRITLLIVYSLLKLKWSVSSCDVGFSWELLKFCILWSRLLMSFLCSMFSFSRNLVWFLRVVDFLITISVSVWNGLIMLSC